MQCEPAALPQEIWDHIITHLQDDIRSLKSCCLVCRTWLLPSRIQLFRKLVFTSNNSYHLSTLFTSGAILPFPPYAVKEVEFCDAQSPAFLLKELLCSFSSCLTKLYFHDMIFDAFPCLVDVICSFPGLRALWLQNVSWVCPIRKELIDVQKKGLSPRLTDLRLRHIDFRVFFSWILAHPSLPPITHLDVEPLDEEAIPYAGRYMLSAGPTVRHLSLGFGFSELWHLCVQDMFSQSEREEISKHPTDRSLNSIAYNFRKKFGVAPCADLAAFTNLQSLRVHSFLDSSSNNHSNATFWIPRLLASIQPASLEELILCLNLSSAGELDNVVIDWDYIDLALSSDLFANLQCVLFEVGGQVNLDGLANLVTSRLPMTRIRGIIRFARPI